MSDNASSELGADGLLDGRERGVRRHPPGLYVLFTVEMWERFSYYGMRALLVLYLMAAFNLQERDAREVYAIYTGLVYLTPLIGGRLADRYLGQRKAVFIGGALMALGQFALCASDLLPAPTGPGPAGPSGFGHGMAASNLLNLGLGLLIIGNGFFKPNISTMVGDLYSEDDLRRDGAYSIFYMGINLGAFIAPLICGWLGEAVRWGYGFAAAGAGMSLGLLTFVFTQRWLQGGGLPPGRPATPGARLLRRDWFDILLIIVALALGTWAVIAAWPWLRPLWSPGWLNGTVATVFYKSAVLLGVLGLFLYVTEPRKSVSETATAQQPFTIVDWQRIGVIAIIGLFSIVFWMGFEQAGGTLNLFALKNTARAFRGTEIPASYFQSINPVFIIALAPVLGALWTYLSRKNFPLPSVAKQGLGLVLLGCAFAVMYLADVRAQSGLVSPLWLIAVYFFFTVGELFLSPIGLSLVNKLAHPRVASLMMAYWFVCAAAANYLAGTMMEIIKPYDFNLWVFLGGMAFGSGLLLLALTPLLVRMSHGRG